MVSDAELVASLPTSGSLPATFQDLVDLGVYDLLGTSAAERKEGVALTNQVLHLNGAWLSLQLLTGA